MEGFLIFGLEKGQFHAYFLTKLSWEIEIWFVNLVQFVQMYLLGASSITLHLLSQPRKSNFWPIFLIFWVCFIQISPSNWTRGWNLVDRCCKNAKCASKRLQLSTLISASNFLTDEEKTFLNHIFDIVLKSGSKSKVFWCFFSMYE